MTDDTPNFRKRVVLATKIVQVRLRFVIVLVAAFLVVGQWGVLRNHWDRFVHRLSGRPTASHSVSSDTEYFCPMDPGVISDWPAICPVCNMDLVRRKKGEAVALPDGVVARMQFSPYRIQLAGIKTSVVEPRKLARDIVLSGRLVLDDAHGQPEAAAGENSKGALSEDLLLVAPAYEADLPWLTPGRRAKVVIENASRAEVRSAVIESASDDLRGEDKRVRLRVANADGQLSPGMFGTATVSIPLTEFEPFRSLKPGETADGLLSIPETAVIDTGSRQVVYVETMPGMFDGVEVSLGPRSGDFFPVLRGLEAGQKVATTGAFLIDAEARLNPSLAAGYFGATQTSAPSKSSSPAITPSKSSPATAKKKLSAADRALVDRQKICPVTELPLDSMGGPIPVEVAGKKVFICCKGCESRLKSDPKKYLAKLKSPE